MVPRSSIQVVAGRQVGGCDFLLVVNRDQAQLLAMWPFMQHPAWQLAALKDSKREFSSKIDIMISCEIVTIMLYSIGQKVIVTIHAVEEMRVLRGVNIKRWHLWDHLRVYVPHSANYEHLDFNNLI